MKASDIDFDKMLEQRKWEVLNLEKLDGTITGIAIVARNNHNHRFGVGKTFEGAMAMAVAPYIWNKPVNIIK